MRYLIHTLCILAGCSVLALSSAPQLKGVGTPNTTDSRFFLADIIGTLGSAVQEMAGSCIWGYNCGGKCAPYQKTGQKRYKDALDKGCLQHDICLCEARSATARKTCDKALLGVAKAVWKKEDKCPSYNPFCRNSDVAAAARDVHNAMAYAGSGKAINCQCKLHPCKTQPSPSPSPSSSSSPSSSDYDYDYDYDYARKRA